MLEAERYMYTRDFDGTCDVWMAAGISGSAPARGTPHEGRAASVNSAHSATRFATSADREPRPRKPTARAFPSRPCSSAPGRPAADDAEPTDSLLSPPASPRSVPGFSPFFPAARDGPGGLSPSFQILPPFFPAFCATLYMPGLPSRSIVPGFREGGVAASSPDPLLLPFFPVQFLSCPTLGDLNQSCQNLLAVVPVHVRKHG
ncbi:hypothetical protein DIPPA_14256 [Diplonema papillatum]|nr:hypothetical protein DIPPA_14256 [Diplonema papillatum]